MSQPHARPNLTALDLVRALAPLVVIILLLVWLSAPSDVEPVQEVDPGPQLVYAATVADFGVLAPAGLPDGWRATSVRVEPTEPGGPDGPVSVSIGYLTADDRFAQLVQSSDPSVLEDVLGAGYAEGAELDVDGRPWRQVQTDDGERGLVRELADVVLVVTGSAGLDDLQTLAAALRPL